MFRRLLLMATLSALPVAAHSQTFTFGLRGTGGMPTGEFADKNGSASGVLLAGAKNGFGFGADVGVSNGLLGVYAGFDRLMFDCAESRCASKATYTLQGVTAGVRVAPDFAVRFAPYAQAGVTFNSLEGGTSLSSISTDRNRGYEMGAGLSYNIGGLVSLNPQLRYVAQNLRVGLPVGGVGTNARESVNYLTFDLGLRVMTPFGGGKR